MKLYAWAAFVVLAACTTPQRSGDQVLVVWNRVDDVQTEEDLRDERRDDAHDLVDDVRRARTRPLVEAVEVLLRAWVLVDLRPDRDQLLVLLDVGHAGER